MTDKINPAAPGTGTPGAPATPAGGQPAGGGTVLPRRSPGHRGQDQRDTVAEMIQKAHEISLEAGSKMATTMKDVIFAAAGISAFNAESAKDLLNYMVRRGQMSAEEAERITREVEAAAEKRPKPPAKPAGKDEPATPSPFARPVVSAPASATTSMPPAVPQPEAKKPAVAAAPAAAPKAPAAAPKAPAAPAAAAAKKAPAKKAAAPKKK